MGFELLGTGAGAAHGLEDLLTRQRADALMRQQGMEKVIGLLGLREDRQARLGQQKAQADALAQSRADANKARLSNVNLQQLQALPSGTVVGENTFNRFTNPETGAAAPEAFDKSPGTPASLPSTSLSGFRPINQGQMGAVTETQEPSKAIAPSFRFKGTAQENDRREGLYLREQMMKQSGANQDWKNSIAQQVAEAKASAQGGQSHFQLTPEVDPTTGAQTGKFSGYNTKLNRFEPISGVTPQSTKAAPGAAAAATDKRTKAETNDTLNQLDQAIENARNFIGPGEGRVSNLDQMIGNANPSIQALGVKMKAAKMRMDHAITGSVRASASPTLLKQWDNILANNVTPEGLKAGVQAMREIIGGGSGPSMVRMMAPDGRALSVPAEKVAELEGHGAKRVP